MSIIQFWLCSVTEQCFIESGAWQLMSQLISKQANKKAQAEAKNIASEPERVYAAIAAIDSLYKKLLTQSSSCSSGN